MQLDELSLTSEALCKALWEACYILELELESRKTKREKTCLKPKIIHAILNSISSLT